MQEIAAAEITAVIPFAHTIIPKNTQATGRIVRNAGSPLKRRYMFFENPPAYLPTKCARCGIVISLGYDGYSTKGNEYWCEACTYKEMKAASCRVKH
jgi:hypothetical protein